MYDREGERSCFLCGRVVLTESEKAVTAAYLALPEGVRRRKVRLPKS